MEISADLLINALIAGLLLGGLVAATVLVENVFAWPGLGSTIVQSILSKDYPVVQGIVLVYGLGGVIAPFLGIKLIDLLIQFIPGI